MTDTAIDRGDPERVPRHGIRRGDPDSVHAALRRRVLLVALFCLAGTIGAVLGAPSPETAVALVTVIQAAGAALLWQQVARRLIPRADPVLPRSLRVDSIIAALAAARAGDLTARTDAESRKGELGPVARAVDDTLESLADLVGNLGATAADVSLSAEGIERFGRVLAERAGRQSSAIAEVARKLKGMGARSEEIGQIVELLEDVAAETNVLALNAALEASRAGAQGKGFGMVADEVRKLAERSAAATKDIGAFIQGIEATTDDTTRSVEEIQGLTEGVLTSASQTATAAATLLSAARALSQTLLRLRVPGQDETDLARALRARRSEIAHALEPIAPLLENAHTPLGEALKQVLVVLAEGVPRPARSLTPTGTAAQGQETAAAPAPPAVGNG
jgi:ABC-type transporter Mla subunit MlaD